MARTYDMTRRAAAVEQTRLRITEAAVELHGSLGPARTTISAVAQRAGVERLTVYRHFPDEAALLAACSSHWLERHPLPDPGAWSKLRDPEQRLRAALRELYRWYRETQPMMEKVLRDADTVPALAAPLREWSGWLAATQAALLAGWGARGRRRRLLAAAIGHALDLRAWSALVEQGLGDDDAVELMAGLARSAAGPSRRAAA